MLLGSPAPPPSLPKCISLHHYHRTTVGYGDITPKNQKEKILAIFVMCSGVSLVGYVTSSITSIMGIRNAQVRT